LVDSGCCAECGKRRQARVGSATERGYDARWGRARQRWLDRFPYCGDRPNGLHPVMSQCFDAGVVTRATHVDHVVPHRHDRRRFWDDPDGNWQSLCASCSARKSQAGL
jgi:5-methylcytosine-specific restriction protein A